MYNDEAGRIFRELKRKDQEMRKPSEPRRYKRQAQNPHSRRPGRGQTTQYRVDKVAGETLTERVDHAEVAMRTVSQEFDPKTRRTNENGYWKDWFAFYK